MSLTLTSISGGANQLVRGATLCASHPRVNYSVSLVHDQIIGALAKASSNHSPSPCRGLRSLLIFEAVDDPKSTHHCLMPQPKTSIVHRTALLTVLLAMVVAIAGCGGSGPASPSAVPSSTAAAAPASPPSSRVDLGDASAYVALAATDITVRARPGGGGVVAVFPAKLPWGSPMPFLVRQAYRDDAGVTWLKVSLPRRPNGSSGWIRGDQVQLRPVAYEVVVELSSRTARLLRDGRTERSWPVGIGRANTPTPTGRFYITVKLRPPQISAVYGAWALGLSGYSDVLEQFGTGDGQIALHGTADLGDLGQEVSNGCVRMTNETITALAGALPPGTPVTIQP
jgi:lipoprotein-anchoring transpeptidase ErfK/SrfK